MPCHAPRELPLTDHVQIPEFARTKYVRMSARFRFGTRKAKSLVRRGYWERAVNQVSFPHTLSGLVGGWQP